MIFTVRATEEADNQLAEIYNRAANAQVIADATNRIDKLLRVDPLRKVRQAHEGFILLPSGRWRSCAKFLPTTDS